MFKHKVSSVVVMGLFVGAAAAYAAEPYPKSAKEGLAFGKPPAVEKPDVDPTAKGKPPYPASAKEGLAFGKPPAVQKPDVDPAAKGKPPYPKSAKEGNPVKP